MSLLVGCGKVTLPGQRYPLMTSFDLEVILNLRAHLRKFDEDIEPSPIALYVGTTKFVSQLC